jgi:hypothetical protein
MLVETKTQTMTQITYIITLTEEEAKYLHELTRNYMGGKRKETDKDSLIRSGLFYATEAVYQD